MDKFKDKLSTITVYCGSSTGAKDSYLEAARSLGELLAAEGIELIYGGGQKGLMGEIANSCLQANGQVTGIIPEFMVDLEWAHTGLTRLYLVDTMTQRKEKLLELGAGIIVLPGGVGTLEEFAEILSWSQLHIHHKPLAFLNIERYYDKFFEFFDHMVKEEFCPANTRDLFIISEDPRELLDLMANFEHHGLPKVTS